MAPSLAADGDAVISWLRITATVTSVFQFLAGAQQCLLFWRKGTTGDASGLPFVAGALSCAIWTTYGVLREEPTIVLVNSLGLGLQASYILCFYLLAMPLVKTHVRQTLAAATTYTLLLLTLWHLDSADRKILLGWLASAASICFCSAPLVSVKTVVRRHSTEVLPFGFIVMTFGVTAQWWVFGALIGDPFVQYPNMVGCVLAVIQLSLFCCFPSSRKEANDLTEELL